MDQQIELGAAIGTRKLSSPTEAVAGRAPYLEVLGQLHLVLRPRLYFEIGVRLGKSLSLAMSDAVGVDPNFAISFQLSAPTRIYKMKSDEFFRDQASSVLKTEIDLAFIDGQRRFEVTLRDFMNIERYSSPFSAIVLDDIFPNHPIQAARERQTSYWAGDVWKIVPCLRRFRPDLTLVAIDTSPTGLLLVLNLSPGNTALADRYDEIVRTYNPETEVQPDRDVLARVDAVDPRDLAIFGELEHVRIARESGTTSTAQRAVQQIHSRICSAPSTSEPDTYSLAELPRNRIAGSVNILNDNWPALECATDAIYLPPSDYVPDSGFGLFRSDGTAVPASIFFRSQGERPFNQPDQIDLSNIKFDRVDGKTYFIGPMMTHYGHFTIETLSRLWALSACPGERPNIVYHGLSVLDSLERFPHVRSILGALGISERNLIRIERPTLLSNIVVAEAAIQPRRCIFAKAMGHYEQIARTFLNGVEAKCEPIYLSKGDISTGVGKVLNEFEVEHLLEREGVRIVHPEKLNVGEQIRMVNAHDRICGIAGSALHTSLFALKRKRIIYLVPHNKVNSNFVSIDICKKHDSSFVFCPSIQAGHSAFISSYRIEQPRRVAELLLKELETAR